jgi:hypothetical protein
MRRRRRTLRELIADLRLSPEERFDARADACMEVLFDPERCRCTTDLGEHQEAVLDAERRRWAGPQPEKVSTTRSSTGR